MTLVLNALNHFKEGFDNQTAAGGESLKPIFKCAKEIFCGNNVSYG